MQQQWKREEHQNNRAAAIEHHQENRDTPKENIHCPAPLLQEQIPDTKHNHEDDMRRRIGVNHAEGVLGTVICESDAVICVTEQQTQRCEQQNARISDEKDKDSSAKTPVIGKTNQINTDDDIELLRAKPRHDLKDEINKTYRNTEDGKNLPDFVLFAFLQKHFADQLT